MLSVYLIAKNEAKNLSRSLGSIKPYADQIVVVDTGSTDSTKEVAASFGAEVYDFNPQTHPESFYLDDETCGGPPPYTGQMHLADFAAARNFSLSKCSQPWRLWIDADDEVKDAHLIKPFLQAQRPNAVVYARYQYALNFWQSRERIVHADSGAKWAGAIHEVLITNGAKVEGPFHLDHHKDHGRGGASHRNYKVLHREMQRCEAEGRQPDSRMLFYYAQEASYIDAARGVELYERYLRSGGWPEERHLARLRMASTLFTSDPHRAAEHYASCVVCEMPHFPDGWFGLAKLAYFRRDWQACIAYSEKGFALGNPPTMLVIDQLDRTLRSHWYYNVALGKVGRTRDALASCLAGLQVSPQDSFLTHNRDYYRGLLGESA